MDVPCLALSQLNRPGQAVSVYRTFYPPGQCYPRHRHAFYEIFFIESGHGSQVIDGRREPLAAGDVGMVDPDCVHALHADAGVAMILTNLAFSCTVVDRLRPLAHTWPWQPGAAPVQPLIAADAQWMRGWITRLDREDSTELELAAFLAGLLLALGHQGERQVQAGPLWLVQALESLDDAEALRGGVAGLVRRCGRSRSQVARAVRVAHGTNTVELLAHRRMEWFARRLRSTVEPIAQLATECGLANLSHCYRVFHRHYDCTPAAYRDRYQGGVTPAY